MIAVHRLRSFGLLSVKLSDAINLYQHFDFWPPLLETYWGNTPESIRRSLDLPVWSILRQYAWINTSILGPPSVRHTEAVSMYLTLFTLFNVRDKTIRLYMANDNTENVELRSMTERSGPKPRWCHTSVWWLQEALGSVPSTEKGTNLRVLEEGIGQTLCACYLQNIRAQHRSYTSLFVHIVYRECICLWRTCFMYYSRFWER
jgi:hypothetical protein